MYSYHNTIKHRIKNNEYLGYTFYEKGEYSIMLHFKTAPFERPIKTKSLHLYYELLKVPPLNK